MNDVRMRTFIRTRSSCEWAEFMIGKTDPIMSGDCGDVTLTEAVLSFMSQVDSADLYAVTDNTGFSGRFVSVYYRVKEKENAPVRQDDSGTMRAV